jgi:hypothetical protein
MDIHPPEGPTRSLKDFATHILIVTIGILIALGLEGIRESIHEHNLLVETRNTFRNELDGDRQNFTKEAANVQDKSTQLDDVLNDFTRLVNSPDQLQKRVDDLEPGFYLFRGTAWGAASSSGVLAYMENSEANKFAEAYFGIEFYQPLSRQALLDWTAVKAFFDSRRSFTPHDATEGEQRLRTLQFDLKTMLKADKGIIDDLNTALGSQ